MEEARKRWIQTACHRTALGCFKHTWCLEPISSKELAAALSQSHSEPSPVSQSGRLTPKQARVDAQAGGQVGSNMDNIYSLATGMGSGFLQPA